MVPRFELAVLTITTIAAFAGCSFILDPEKCQSDSDCEGPAICTSGVCVGDSPDPGPDSAGGNAGGGGGGSPGGAGGGAGGSVAGDASDARLVEAGSTDGGADLVDVGDVPDAVDGGIVADFHIVEDAGRADTNRPDAFVPVDLPPTCSFIEPQPEQLATPTNARTIRVVIEATDDITPPEELEVTLNNRPVQLDENGRYVDDALPLVATRVAMIGLDVRDGTGHPCDASISVILDREAPLLTIDEPADGNACCGVGSCGEGTYHIVGRVLTNEAVRPTLSVRLRGEAVAQEAIIWTQADVFEFDVTLEPGENQIEIRAVDAAGNPTEDASTIEIDYDIERPTVEILTPTDGALRDARNAEVSGRVSDNVAPGLTRVNIYVDGPGARLEACETCNDIIPEANGDFGAQIPLFEGDNEIVACVVDPCGNESCDSVAVNVNTLPPLVRITDPGDLDVVDSDIVTVRGTMTSNTQAVELMVEGADDSHPAPLNMETLTWEGTVTLPRPATHVVLARATSRSGQTATAEVRVVYDETPPDITIDQPDHGACISSNPVLVSGRVHDDEVLVMSVQVNGSGAPVSGDGTFFKEIILPAGRDQIITVEATNFAELQSEETRTVDMDLAPPDVALDSPVPGGFATAGPTGLVMVEGRVTDGGCGVSSLEIDGAPVGILDGVRFSYGLSLQEGPASIVIVATDLAGHFGTTPVEFSVDLTPPQVTDVEPSGFLATREATVNVRARVSDEGSGIDTVELNGDPVRPDDAGAVSRRYGLREGPNSVLIVATDGVGLTREVRIEINRDLDDPLITIETPGDQMPVESPLRLTGTFDDGELGSGVVSIEVNGESAEIDHETGQWTYPNLDLIAGSNDIWVVAEDAAGNQSASAEITVFIRDFAPVEVGRMGLEGTTEVGWIGAADLNRDGAVDIISLPGRVDGIAAVFLQNEQGSFDSRTAAEAGLPAELAVAGAGWGDFDGDGNLDIIYGGPQENGLLLGNGAGGFRVVDSNVPQGIAVLAVAVGDANRDGNLDSLMLAGANTVLLLGAGNGVFLNEPLEARGLGGLTAMSHGIMVDVTRDQIPDIVAVGPGGSALWAGNSEGDAWTFDQADAEETGFRSRTGATVHAVDGDRDGDLDVLTVHDDPVFHMNNLSAVDGDTRWLVDERGLLGLRGEFGATVGDVDGDSRDDILLFGPEGIRLIRNQAEELSWVRREDAGIPSLSNVRAVTLVDLDGDNDLDMLVGGPLGIEVMRSNATLITIPFRAARANLRRGRGGQPGPNDAVGIVAIAGLDDGAGAFDRAMVVPPSGSLIVTMGDNRFAQMVFQYPRLGVPPGPVLDAQRTLPLEPGEEISLDAPQQ